MEAGQRRSRRMPSVHQLRQVQLICRLRLWKRSLSLCSSHTPRCENSQEWKGRIHDPSATRILASIEGAYQMRCWCASLHMMDSDKRYLETCDVSPTRTQLFYEVHISQEASIHNIDILSSSLLNEGNHILCRKSILAGSSCPNSPSQGTGILSFLGRVFRSNVSAP